MELQTFLRTQGLAALTQQYQIKINRHQQYPHLVCLKYSQQESPLSATIVQQCRGIILDAANNWSIVSYPYDKFFNHGEAHAAPIDWTSAQVYDKLDGSLMVLYHYNHQWHVQTSGTADASGEVGGFDRSFQQLFWQVWQELGYQLPSETDHCFIFELMTPYNRVVVKHQQNKLVLHGVRNRVNLQEEAPQTWADRYGWQVVATFALNNLKSIIAAAQTLDPLTSEGYIICDRAFRRIKVKSPQYVALAHLREGFSPRRLLEIVMNNEGEEFLVYYPEWGELYNQLRQKYDNLIHTIATTYQTHQYITTQKDYAIAIQPLPYSSVLFALRSGKASTPREAIQHLSRHRLEQLLLT
jgi:tRNA splicing ligase